MIKDKIKTYTVEFLFQDDGEKAKIQIEAADYGEALNKIDDHFQISGGIDSVVECIISIEAIYEELGSMIKFYPEQSTPRGQTPEPHAFLAAALEIGGGVELDEDNKNPNYCDVTAPDQLFLDVMNKEFGLKLQLNQFAGR